MFLFTLSDHEKSKITNFPNSEGNSKPKVIRKIAKSKAQTNETNGKGNLYFKRPVKHILPNRKQFRPFVIRN